MEFGAVNNFHVIVKQITKFDLGGRTSFWSGILSFALAFYRVQQDNFQRLTRAGAAVRIRRRPGDHSRDLGCRKSRSIQRALFFSTAGSSVLLGLVVSGQNIGWGSTTRTTGVGSPSREIRKVSAGGHSGGANQDDKHADAPRPRPRRLFVPHEQLPGLSQRVRSTGSPADRQYEDIALQALPSEYDRIRQTHLERRDYDLADIRRMMSAIYANNLSRSE